MSVEPILFWRAPDYPRAAALEHERDHQAVLEMMRRLRRATLARSLAVPQNVDFIDEPGEAEE